MASYAIMTNTGRAKEAAALAAGTSLTMTEIAWGDGDHSPSGGETALQSETGRKAIQASGTVDGQTDAAFFEIELAVTDGPFTIREAGLFDADGDLLAIARYDPPVNKPLDSVSALLRLNVVFSDLESLVIVVPGTDAYVPAERRINTGLGLVGGGDLGSDLTLALDWEAKSFGSTDFDLLPNGRIEQWGIGATDAVDGTVGVTFPVAFPNACLNVTFGERNINQINANAHVIGYTNLTATGFDATAVNTGGNLVSSGFCWRAIGF